MCQILIYLSSSRKKFCFSVSTKAIRPCQICLCLICLLIPEKLWDFYFRLSHPHVSPWQRDSGNLLICLCTDLIAFFFFLVFFYRKIIHWSPPSRNFMELTLELHTLPFYRKKKTDEGKLGGKGWIVLLLWIHSLKKIWLTLVSVPPLTAVGRRFRAPTATISLLKPKHLHSINVDEVERVCPLHTNPGPEPIEHTSWVLRAKLCSRGEYCLKGNICFVFVSKGEKVGGGEVSWNNWLWNVKAIPSSKRQNSSVSWNYF